MSNTELNFFASANSGRGFINFYGDVFKGLKKHYIIKGGPGTGKSTLMKAVATKAKSNGMTVEHFYCSSDPDSLDGIIIKELSVGITDGTSPHTADPKYPGVTDEIVDLGSFWNTEVLAKSKDTIIETVNTKNNLYKDAYSYLSAALSLESIKQRRLLSTADIKSLYALTRSYTDVIPYRRGNVKVRLTEGITMKGHCIFSPYKSTADIIYNIKDANGIGHLFLRQIKELLTDNEIIVSYEALDTEKLNMLFLPADKILFCINADEGEDIYIDDFVSANDLYTETVTARKKELLSDAYALLAEIEKQHFSLEDIYISAMDFSRKEEYQEKLIREIFS